MPYERDLRSTWKYSPKHPALRKIKAPMVGAIYTISEGILAMFLGYQEGDKKLARVQKVNKEILIIPVKDLKSVQLDLL